MIKRLLRLVGRWARKPVNHTSWVAVVTPTDRPKSVRNRCLIELFCGVVCVVTLPFWHFCWCRGFCHRTESDLFLFLLTCPSQHRHGTTLFIRWFRHTAPFSRLLRSRWGYGGHILDLTPQARVTFKIVILPFDQSDCWKLTWGIIIQIHTPNLM